jgi:hypothetical protein
MPSIEEWVGGEDKPFGLMCRAELLDRLSSVALLHTPPIDSIGEFRRCRACGEPHPCSTRITATGVTHE